MGDRPERHRTEAFALTRFLPDKGGYRRENRIELRPTTGPDLPQVSFTPAHKSSNAATNHVVQTTQTTYPKFYQLLIQD
ncbi:hypothetical protein QUA70_04820 [Microcoleus sp. LAD1_D5]|uniref:hypothetical protein n=1 Tax=unclassified Microcoleus TaxID=2642155 RepID=UPI002FD296EF